MMFTQCLTKSKSQCQIFEKQNLHVEYYIDIVLKCELVLSFGQMDPNLIGVIGLTLGQK